MLTVCAPSVWLSPDWSSVSPGCRPPPHLSRRRETWAKDATRWPVAHAAAPRGYASTGRVRLKAHPVPQPKPRDPSRGPRAAFPSSTCRQERAGESKAQRSCAVLLLTYLPIRGGEMAEEAPARWPNGFGKVAAGAPDAPSANPGASTRSRSASSHDRPATGACLGHVSVRAERWLGGRQPGETLDQFGDSQKRVRMRLTSLATATI